MSAEHKLKLVGDPSRLHLTPKFQDHAELMRSKKDGLWGYGLVAMVQKIRRHPKLRATIEGVATRLGRKIDLTQRLT